MKFITILLFSLSSIIFAQDNYLQLKYISPIRNNILVLYFDEGYIRHIGYQESDNAQKLYKESLNIPNAEKTVTYSVISNDDSNFTNETHPKRIARKSRGNDVYRKFQLSLVSDIVYEHYIYLEFENPFQSGINYIITVNDSTLDTTQYNFVFNEKDFRSDAIHTNHLGYSPKQRMKYAYISQFMGQYTDDSTVARLELDDLQNSRFYIVDKANRESILFEGTIKKRKDIETGSPDGQRWSSTNPPNSSYCVQSYSSPLSETGPYQNWVGADLWECDFSDFNQEGDFVIYVEGIGCSYPFKIKDDAVYDAFRKSARSLFFQRAGIEKNEPYSEGAHQIFPRDHHPDDGFVVNGFTKETTPWGWYHDAGDWDTYPTHVQIPAYLLTLYELKSSSFYDGQLNIVESGNGLPDIIDEARWQIDYMRRAVGVNGGIHTRIDFENSAAVGIPSWEDPTKWNSSGEDFLSTYHLAALEAQLAYCINIADSTNDEIQTLINEAVNHYNVAKRKNTSAYSDRAWAAAWLFKFTGLSEYQNDFNTAISNIDLSAKTFGQNPNYENWAVYAYTTTDNEIINNTLKNNLKSIVKSWADNIFVNSAQSRGNRVGLLMSMPHVNGQATTPYVISSIMAYEVSGDEKYLDYVYTTCDYMLGGNGMNMTWMTGLGYKSPREVLHLDSWYNGDPDDMPLEGIVPYGPIRECDRGDAWFNGPWDNDMGRNTHFPYHRLFPINELYVENRYNPQGNEFTIHQNIAPAVFAYGYISAKSENVTSMEEIFQGNSFPKDFKLFQNFPNLFNPETIIKYQIPYQSRINISLYDILGNKIDTIIDEYKNSGTYQLKYKNAQLASGIYIITLSSDFVIDSKKIVLLK